MRFREHAINEGCTRWVGINPEDIVCMFERPWLVKDANERYVESGRTFVRLKLRAGEVLDLEEPFDAVFEQLRAFNEAQARRAARGGNA